MSIFEDVLSTFEAKADCCDALVSELRRQASGIPASANPFAYASDEEVLEGSRAHLLALEEMLLLAPSPLAPDFSAEEIAAADERAA